MDSLLDHIRETTSGIDGVVFKDIYFPKDKDEFILAIDWVNENKYLKWRKICPPPSGAKDWYEILLTKKEFFPK